MKNLFVFLLLLVQPGWLLSQETKPEIMGNLVTGELLTAVYSGSLIKSYSWTIANDASGKTKAKEVSKSQVYRLKQGDSGKFIRLEVTTFSLKGRKETYYSNWSGPVRNGIPVITGEVTISGALKVGNIITANYLYDPDNNPESGTTFRWYLADNLMGSNSILISSSGASLQLLPYHEPKYVRVEVTPRDIYGTAGANYSSNWYGPIEKADEINRPPVVSNVKIRGNPVYCGVLTGLYDYSDSELDAEGESKFRWLRAPENGGSAVPIEGATSRTYTVSTEDKGMYIYFEIIPVAVSGYQTGSTVLSNPTSLIQGDLPSVTFAGNASICEGASAIISLTFSGTPPFNLDYTNGTKNFSISTSSYTYKLTVNTGGKYQGTKLTDILNCPVTALLSVAEIIVKPKPKLDFSAEKTCYTGDSTSLKNNSSSKNTIRSWSWNFGDNASGKNTSTVESPKHKYPSAGSYRIWLAGENTDGCKDTVYKTIVLGENPVAGFSWDKECFSSGMTVNFQNNSISKEKITKVYWSIRDESKLLKETTNIELAFNVPNTGNYNVKLKVTTELGCSDSTTKVFSAKPVVKLLDSMYSNDFEGTTNNWNIEAVSKNNWVWGDPEGITISSPHSGSRAFYTTFPEKRMNQQLVVTSPCFDFSSIEKPFIDLWINYANHESKEGAVLQYRQDGENAWTAIGNIGSGLNWYNNNGINPGPGNQSLGWSGNSNGWKQARQSLEDLSNKTSVRFRIVYSSTADANPGDGFAFDDIFIGQRGKKVLVEHFTNLSDALSNQANVSVDSIINKVGTNVVGIQYHTSFPGPDSLNEHNTANPAARALFYGIGKVPVTYLDGGWIQNYIYDFTTRKMSANDVNNRMFEEPVFDLNITSAITGNVMSGKVTVTALRNLQSQENILYTTIVEDINISASGRTFTLRNVLKYIYPSSAGTMLASNWTKDQSSEFNFSWTMGRVFNLSKLKVVAFIQNNQTKEVYQVESVLNSSITSTPFIENKEVWVIYPNPVNDIVHVTFENQLKDNHKLEIINPEGRVVKEYPLQKGISEISFSVAGYPPGVYYIRLFSSGYSKTAKILITAR